MAALTSMLTSKGCVHLRKASFCELPQRCLVASISSSANSGGHKIENERKYGGLVIMRNVVVRAGEGAATSAGAAAEVEPLLNANSVVESPKADAAPISKPKLNAAVTESMTVTKVARKKPVDKPQPVDKPLASLMSDDVIPELQKVLEKEEISDLILVFEDNQLQGCFRRNGIPYSFWAYFPDGKLEGSRGFSFSSHGAPPSTVEPFLIDEKKITAKLVVFWVWKRLIAQSVFTQVSGA